jgi:hypothetical protein
MFLAVTTFWGAFFLCLIWIPLAILWIGALIDVFHRDDLGGGAKALWVVAIIVLPWIGALSYLITRPTGVTPEERAAMEQTAYTPRVTPT